MQRKFLEKIFYLCFVFCFLFLLTFPSTVNAQQDAEEKAINAQLTILPDAGDMTIEQCNYHINKSVAGSDIELISSFFKDESYRNTTLGCAIKTGRVSFYMIPYFFTYIADFLLGLASIISVLFIVIGGYNYIYGGLTDKKDKGKKTITNAVFGLVLSLLSWSIVRLVLFAVTS